MSGVHVRKDDVRTVAIITEIEDCGRQIEGYFGVICGCEVGQAYFYQQVLPVVHNRLNVPFYPLAIDGVNVFIHGYDPVSTEEYICLNPHFNEAVAIDDDISTEILGVITTGIFMPGAEYQAELVIVVGADWDIAV